MALIKRSGKWGVQIYRQGQRDWIGTFESHAEAKEAERKAMARVPTRGRETVSAFTERYLTDFNTRGERWSEDTLRTLRYALKPFSEAFGSKRLNQLQAAELRRWASNQSEVVVRAIRALLNDAQGDGLVSENPLAKLGRERSRGRADIVALTEEELFLLADSALVSPLGDYGPEFRAFLIFQGIQGLRPKATGLIRPSDVHGESLYVRTPGKKVASRTVYLFPEVAEALASMPRKLGAEWLFTSRQGHRLSKTNLTYSWNEVRSVFETKLDPRRKAELSDARPRGGSLTLYELRHAAATIQLRRGLTPEQVAWNLGHSDGGVLVNQLYGHPTDQDRIEAMRRGLQIRMQEEPGKPEFAGERASMARQK